MSGRGEPVRVVDDGERVALEAGRGEDVDERVAAGGHPAPLSCRSRSRAAGAARTRAGRAPGSPGGSRASPRARPRRRAASRPPRPRAPGGAGARVLSRRRLVLEPGLRVALARGGRPGSGSASASGSRCSSSAGSSSGSGSVSSSSSAGTRPSSSPAGSGSANSGSGVTGVTSGASAASAGASAAGPRGSPSASSSWRATSLGVGAAAALELEVLADGVVEQSHQTSTAYSAFTVRFLPERFARYSAASAAATSASLSVLAECGSAATPNDAVTWRTPSPSSSGQLEGLDLGADALRELERAVQAGLWQRDRHLLAAVAGGLVHLARGLAQHAGDLAQHVVALEVAVGVVDALEVVDVEHDQPELLLEPAHALDLRGHDLLEAAVVEEAGELVRDRLALDRLVQADVLDRDRRLAREIGEELLLALGEGAAGPRDRDHADHAVVRVGGRQRAGERVRAGDLRLGGRGVGHRGGLGGHHRREVGARRCRRARPPPAGRRSRWCAARRGRPRRRRRRPRSARRCPAARRGPGPCRATRRRA